MKTTWKEFKTQAKPGCRLALVADLKSDMETPVSLFHRYRRERYAFLLESAAGGERWGRYSFIGLYPEIIFKSKGRKVTLTQNGKTSRFTSDYPLQELKKIHQQYPYVLVPNAPRFPGGAVGFAAYDEVRFFEKVLDKPPTSLCDDLQVPDLFFIYPKVILALDNVAHRLQIIYNAVIKTPGDIRREYDRGSKKLAQVARDLKKIRGKGRRQSVSPKRLVWKQNWQQADFETGVRKIRDYVYAGDVTQTVLSLRFETKGVVDGLDLYRSIRRINPSPYLFYLQYDDLRLVGASPETMVHLEGRDMTVRPIAGTRKRGQTEAEDLQLEQDLLADPKERAEHIMLVDLGRNDLGRVAQPGTVEVDQLMAIERYSHVMHIVSNVRATLAKDKDAFDLLQATFPAGTLSGSPKVRAMQIIDELEPTRRGAYGGCVGYFAYSGNMDMAITIRSALIKGGKLYVQAGAGIVADSVPEKEYEECCNKAKGMMEAVRRTLEDVVDDR